MNLVLSHCFVNVSDPDEALAFYRDVLELEVRTDVSAEGFRWITLSPPSQPELELVLLEPGSGPGRSDRDVLLTLLAKGSLQGVIFRTDDVNAVFEKIRAAGAEVMQEPMDMPYGVRDCAFRDPSGNMVRIGQFTSTT
jgi:catechol 2,3-dioxygenase-like lactoylglutathione lyase family enzyme